MFSLLSWSVVVGMMSHQGSLDASFELGTWSCGQPDDAMALLEHIVRIPDLSWNILFRSQINLGTYCSRPRFMTVFGTECTPRASPCETSVGCLRGCWMALLEQMSLGFLMQKC